MPSSQPLIQATSQQSRFHAATLDAETSKVDLSGVTISVGELEVLIDADLTLKEGVRYGLVGRNGAGKSTLFRALADRLIPGLPPSLKVHLVTQVDESPIDDPTLTALQCVLYGHTARREAMRERDILAKAAVGDDDSKLRDVWQNLEKEKAEAALEEARRIASRRSGARGKKAREEEIAAEKSLEKVTDKVDRTDTRSDAVFRLEELRLDLELLEADTSDIHIRGVMKGLGFKPEMIDGPYSALSGGWRSRVRLATALIVQTDILILDEPTNFMDLSALIWLEKTLPTLTTYSTLVITSHDQTFLDRVAEKTIALRHQRLDYFDGPPSTMYTVEAESRKAMETVRDALAKKKEHIQASISEGRKSARSTGDENRLRMVKSRQKKLDDRWGLEQSAKGTRFKLNRDLGGYHTSKRADVSKQEEEASVTIRLDQPPPLRQKGGSMVSLERVVVGWNTGEEVLRDVGLVVHPGTRIGLVGANGTGKSTLAKVIASTLPPRSGTITTHPQARIGYFAQHEVESLSTEDNTALAYFVKQANTGVGVGAGMVDVAGAITNSSGNEGAMTEAKARNFLGRFGLSGHTVSAMPIRQLSGGQKVRLVLAKLMYRPPHLLILDEVTTHLDVQTIRALAIALQGWQGAIVLVTHDRWFCKAVIDGDLGGESPDITDGPGRTEKDGMVPAVTYRVIKKGLKKLEGGLAEYEKSVRAKLDRAER